MDLLDQGLDLLDFYRGKLSLRRLCVAISQLPTTSRVVGVVAETERWGIVEYMLASLIDAVLYGNYLQEVWLYGNREKGSGGTEPKPSKPVFRPGQKPEEEKIEFTDPVTLAGAVSQWG